MTLTVRTRRPELRAKMVADVAPVDAVKGIAEVICNTSLLDHQDDVMEPGCWSDIVAGMRSGTVAAPALCWAHENGMNGPLVLLGGVKAAQELKPGDPRIPLDLQTSNASALWARVEFDMDTQVGREAFSSVRKGYIRQWSVGFTPDPLSVRYNGSTRHIGKVKDWIELSPVLMGASIGTRTLATKASGWFVPARVRAAAQPKVSAWVLAAEAEVEAEMPNILAVAKAEATREAIFAAYETWVESGWLRGGM